MTFAADGTFSFVTWVEALQGLPAEQLRVGTAWLRSLQLSLGAHPSFVDMFAATMGSKKLGPLHAQLLWHSGWRLQVLVQSSLQGSQALGVDCTPWKMLDLLEQPYQLDKYLASYVYAAQRRWTGRLHYSLCTDKASVGGLSLQNTMVCTPDGVALMAPPQVVLLGVGGLGGSRGRRHRGWLPGPRSH